MRYHAKKKVSSRWRSRQRQQDPHQKQYVPLPFGQGYDADANANADTNRIRTKNNTSPSPSVGDIIPLLVTKMHLPNSTNETNKIFKQFLGTECSKINQFS